MGLKARQKIARPAPLSGRTSSAQARAGDIFAYPLPGGGYGACQVLVQTKSQVNIVALDGAWPSLPSCADVEKAEARRGDWQMGIWVDGLGYRTDHVGPDVCWVDPDVPWWATRVAHMPPKEPEPKVTVVGDDWIYYVQNHHPRADLKSLKIEASELAGKTLLDLSTEKIESVSLEANGEALTVILPPTVWLLRLSGALAGLRIVNQGSSSWPLRVWLNVEEFSQAIPGLEKIQALKIEFQRTVDARHLAHYPRLVQLELCAKNGQLDHIEALSELPALEELKLEGIYQCDAARFPDQNSLRVVRIRGTRRSIADILKPKLKGVPRVKITGAKTDAWLAENFENPFRDWGEAVSAALARGAIAAWKSASREVAAIESSGDTAKAALKSFVEELNRLNSRYDIETAERESAFEAFLSLASKVGVGGGDAHEWFDEWREF